MFHDVPYEMLINESITISRDSRQGHFAKH